MAMAFKDEVPSSESSDDDQSFSALRRYAESWCSTEAGSDAGGSSISEFKLSSKAVYVLIKKNAKERKAERSKQRKLGKKCIGPMRANPPPKLCNRSGSAWNDAPYPCECGKWPQWIAEAPLELCKSKKNRHSAGWQHY